MTEFSLRPNTDAMATARTMYGMARNTSMIRVISVSLQPRKNPAMAPRITPITSNSTVARMPIFSDTRAPYTTRV
jgi:hypothetical protein